MDSNNIKNKIRESVLLSAGLFLLGKNKLEEFIKSLEESGMTKEEAEKTANEALHSAKKHKDSLIKRLTKEIEEKNVFATKDDMKKIEKTLEEISTKLDE